jgi:hypothetical protein
MAAPGLLAVAFDLSRREAVGAPAAVLEYPGLSGPNVAVSRSGTPAYVAGGSAWGREDMYGLVWVDAQGGSTPALSRPGYFEAPRLAPMAGVWP